MHISLIVPLFSFIAVMLNTPLSNLLRRIHRQSICEFNLINYVRCHLRLTLIVWRLEKLAVLIRQKSVDALNPMWTIMFLAQLYPFERSDWILDPNRVQKIRYHIFEVYCRQSSLNQSWDVGFPFVISSIHFKYVFDPSAMSTLKISGVSYG